MPHVTPEEVFWLVGLSAILWVHKEGVSKSYRCQLGQAYLVCMVAVGLLKHLQQAARDRPSGRRRAVGSQGAGCRESERGMAA